MNLYQKYKYNKIFTKKQIFGFLFFIFNELFLISIIKFRGSY